MAKFYLFFCLALVGVCPPESEANPFLTPNATIDNMVNLLTEMAHQTFLGNKCLKIKKSFLNISSNEKQVYSLINNLSSYNIFPSFVRKIKELYQYFTEIDFAYNKFVDIFTNFHMYNESKEVVTFVESTTSFSLVELQATVGKMHETFADKDIIGESTISILADETKISDAMHLNKSIQQLIYALYEVVITMNTKAFITTAYCYDLREKFENQSYEYTKTKLRAEYIGMVWQTFKKVKIAMQAADRRLLKADPKVHQKDVTHSRLFPVLQGTFIYEAYTTAGRWYTFWHQCESLGTTKLKAPSDQSCNGLLRDCHYVDSSIDICRSNKDDRKYSWAVTKSHDVLGHKDSECPEKIENTYGVLTYDVCLCTCENEYIEKDRYFSLQSVLSNTDENKVITGVRLVKKEHVFYISIQEATLGGNGSIIDSPQWQPVKEESLIDLYNSGNTYQVSYTRNTVFLDVLTSRFSYALTGLRFQRFEDSLRLEALMTSFNYKTGKLRRKNSWLTNPNGIDTRENVKLVSPDIPIKMPEHKDISHNNRYVSFRMTDLHRDLGQTLVPFVDTQEVVTNPPMPLSGVGLYHKGRSYSGGFLGIQLYHYDYTHHM